MEDLENEHEEEEVDEPQAETDNEPAAADPAVGANSPAPPGVLDRMLNLIQMRIKWILGIIAAIAGILAYFYEIHNRLFPPPLALVCNECNCEDFAGCGNRSISI